MSGDPRATAALALHRFGLGPRPGSVSAIASDPRGALLAVLDRPDAGRLKANLPPSDQATRDFFRARSERRRTRDAEARLKRERAAAEAGGMAESAAASGSDANSGSKRMEGDGARLPTPNFAGQRYQEEAQARADAALGAEFGLVEKLVWFWSNHFCVGAKTAYLRVVAGGFEREAIRPHVLGRFSDMLLAVESHPAMLAYLNNRRSVGLYSEVGLTSGRGLNENLAREILELHTLGVRTVYAQADVTSFASVLTGWGMLPPDKDPERGGQFAFEIARHEPGEQTILGKRYPDTGVEQGRSVLADLARHPATASNIATKLAVHFVSDNPPPVLIDRIATRFRETGGDLKEVTKALLQSPEAWDAARQKLKRPGEWMISGLRAAGAKHISAGVLIQGMRALGEPLWMPPAPKGFSDLRAEWTNGLSQRLDVAVELAERIESGPEPLAILDDALGPLASAETRSTIARAGDRNQALALLLMAPEFQLR